MIKPSLWARWWTPIAVLSIVVCVFAPTLWFTQSGVDDHWLWALDSPLRAVDRDVLHHIWFDVNARSRHDLGTEYLPVRDMFVAFDMAVWGPNFRGPHLTQLVLYVVTVFGLGRLLLRFGLRADLAWVAVLLWAIHPLHVESVAWISERKGLLAGLFVIACGHAWHRYREERSAWWLVTAALCAVAGVWSKAPAMFGPAAIAAWDLLLLPAHRRRWTAIVTVGVVTALAAIPVLLVAHRAGVVDNAYVVAHDSRPIAALGALGHYAASFTTLRGPTYAYPMQTHGATVFDVIAGLLVAVLAMLLWQWRGEGRAWRRAFVAWGTLWFVPVSHLVTRIHIPVADRYVYLWTLSGAAGLAWALTQLRGVARVAALSGTLGLFALLAIRAQAAWTGGTAIFARAYETDPSNAQMTEGYARILYMFGDPLAALAVVTGGLRERPDDPYLLAYESAMLTDIGLDAAALDASTRAVASGHASIMHQHAGLLAYFGRNEEALRFARRAADRRPEEPLYSWRVLRLLLRLRRYPEAALYARALAVRFPGPASETLLATVYRAWGKPIESAAHGTLALILGADPRAIRDDTETVGPLP